MDIVLTGEQELLFKTALDFAQDALTSDQIRALEEQEPGFDPGVWHRMAEMGWAGTVFAADYGGSGLTLFELALIVEACAQAALPSPLFSSVIEAGLLIAKAGSEAQRQAWLPRIVSGETVLTAAVFEPSGGFAAGEIQTRAELSSNGYRLNGTKLFVRDATAAEAIVVSARSGASEDDLSLILVPYPSPGLVCKRLAAAGGEALYEMTFTDVEAPAHAVLGEAGGAWPHIADLHNRGACLKAAELVGIGQAALDLTLSYAKTRVQFGRPIGSFQAVQHHCVQMYRDLQACRLLTYQAATRLTEGQPAARDVAIAKAKSSQAVPGITRLAHQIHGATAYYRTYPLELYYHRALAAQAAYGDAMHHRRCLARLLRQNLAGFRGNAPHRLPGENG